MQMVVILNIDLDFFFRYMREMIENGYIYIVNSPLYLVRKGKQAKYAWDDKERDGYIDEMKGSGSESSVHVQRYKGLGEIKTLNNYGIRLCHQRIEH